MSALTDLRKAICKKTKPFTSESLAYCNIPSLSERLTDLINTGDLEVVGTLEMKGMNPMNIYKKTNKEGKAAKPVPVEARQPIKGLTLRVVQWCEGTGSWKEAQHPCYDPIPPCPTLLELLQNLSWQ